MQCFGQYSSKKWRGVGGRGERIEGGGGVAKMVRTDESGRNKE